MWQEPLTIVTLIIRVWGQSTDMLHFGNNLMKKNDVDDHIPMTRLLPPDPPLFNVCIHPHFEAIS